MGRGSVTAESLSQELRSTATIDTLIAFPAPAAFDNPAPAPELPHRPDYPLKDDSSHYSDSPFKDSGSRRALTQPDFAAKKAETEAAVDAILAAGIPAGPIWKPEVLRAASAFRLGDIVVLPEKVGEDDSNWQGSSHLHERRVESAVYWQGRRLGRVSRMVVRNRRGQTALFNIDFTLDHALRGQGLGRAYARHFEEICRKRGVREICVHAGETVGGYAWATPGWQLAGDEEHQRYQLTRLWLGFSGSEFGGRDRTRWAWEEGRYPKELWDATDRYFYGIASGQLPVPTPAELARIGEQLTWEENGQRRWFGKELLLGANWEGRKFLKVGVNETFVPPAWPHWSHRSDLKEAVEQWGNELSS